MKNPKLLLKIGGGVTAVFAVVALVFIVLGILSASDAEENRKKAFGAFKGLYQSDPFPSAENTEVAHANAGHARAWAADLSRRLSRNAGKVETDFSGSWLKEELFRRLDTLRADAPLDESGKPVVDEGFTFDFERYAASTPEDKDVPRLLLQLNLIDHFVRVLYAHGIHHLDAVGRVPFEDGSSEDSSSSSRGSRSSRPERRPGSRGGRGAPSAAPTVQLQVTQPSGQESPVFYSRERIGLAFRSKQAALLAILDEIDTSWPYVAISGLRIEKIFDDVRFPDEGAAKKDAAAAEAAAPAAAARPAPRSAQLVSGALREQFVQVELYLDLYSMVPPEGDPDGEDDGESAEEEL